jgi:hypothetical protein
MPIIRLLTGVLLLTMGRKLYWLLIAVIGFFLGYWIADFILPEISNVLVILIGLLFGSLCALLAVFLNRVAIAIAGFLGGGLIATQLMIIIRSNSNEYSWVPFIIGGIVGIILAAILFDWVLIIFSSIIGAFLIESTWSSSPIRLNLLVIVIIMIGIGVQTIQFKRQG